MGANMARTKQADAQVIELIKAVPIFSACTQKELKGIATSGKEVRFEAGRVICEEGQTGVGMHVILAGEVKVLVGGRTRRRLGPGAFFGEIALLDGGPRSASVVAETPVRTFGITSWNFRAVLKSHPSLPLKMLEEVSRRLRENERSLSN
jgi:CRP-like cAMP-binding protein